MFEQGSQIETLAQFIKRKYSTSQQSPRKVGHEYSQTQKQKLPVLANENPLEYHSGLVNTLEDNNKSFLPEQHNLVSFGNTSGFYNSEDDSNRNSSISNFTSLPLSIDNISNDVNSMDNVNNLNVSQNLINIPANKVINIPDFDSGSSPSQFNTSASIYKVTTNSVGGNRRTMKVGSDLKIVALEKAYAGDGDEYPRDDSSYGHTEEHVNYKTYNQDNKIPMVTQMRKDDKFTAINLNDATESSGPKLAQVFTDKIFTEEHRLVEYLFDGYNKHIRPTDQNHEPTHVYFQLSLLNILEMVRLFLFILMSRTDAAYYLFLYFLL